MQKYEENVAISEDLWSQGVNAVMDAEEAAYCDVTRRIVMISPLPASLHSLVAALTAQCYDVMLFHHADDPMLTLLQGDLLIIDRTKGMGGIEKAQSLFQGKIPTIFLVHEGSNSSSSHGEILAWPCPVEIVLSKIQGLAARMNRTVKDISANRLIYKDLALDLERMAVNQAGSKIDLTKTEFDLLKVLLHADGKVLTRQDMMNLVWDDQYFGGSNSVDVHIKSLRRKLRDNPKSPSYIATVRGVGYRTAD